MLASSTFSSSGREGGMPSSLRPIVSHGSGAPGVRMGISGGFRRWYYQGVSTSSAGRVTMGSSHPDLQKYERALSRYFQVPANERKTREREKILKVLGVENPQEFIGMHIPLWEAKIDELLDPTSTDMLPISIAHSYVNWVRGAIRMMPAEARVLIFSSKFKATGLKKAILALLHEVTGKPHRDFEVTEVLLIEKVHKDTLFTVRTPDGKEREFYLSRFGCIGESIYSGLPK